MGGTRIATVRPAAGAGADACANVLYYHRDYQGSVVGTSLRSGGVDGVVGAGYRYTPYGQLDRATNVTAASDSELGYTNGLRLLWRPGVTPALPQGPGLVLLGARVYHAELKRWLQPDTVDALRYTYTGGDPVNFIDPSGRTMIDPHSDGLKGSIANWDFLGAFQLTLSPKNSLDPAPSNNEPAPTPVATAAQVPVATTTEQKIDVRKDNGIPDDITVYPPGGSPKTDVKPVDLKGPTVVTSTFEDTKTPGHGNGHCANDCRGAEGASVYSQYDGVAVAGSDSTGKPWRAVVKSFKEDGSTFGQAYNHIAPSVKAGDWIKAGQQIGTIAVGPDYNSKLAHLDLIHIPDFDKLPVNWNTKSDGVLRQHASPPVQNWNLFYREKGASGWRLQGQPVDVRWRSPDYVP
jgi:murein DD-endopeptidase MepM/ murein hydrolase activator NlpD